MYIKRLDIIKSFMEFQIKTITSFYILIRKDSIRMTKNTILIGM